MNELLVFNQKALTIDSREVAEMMDTSHDQIIRKLEGAKDRKGIIEVLTDNQMVVSNYFIESSYKDGSGKQNKCYLCTKMGCEFLANKFTGEKGIIFTAKYVDKFNKMEQGQTAQLQNLSPQLQILINMELKQKEMELAITETKEEVSAMREIVALSPTQWRKDSASLINKMALKLGGYEHIKTLREESYKLLNERMGVALGIRLTNKRKTMADNGVCKSKRDKLTYVDVIADDKKLIEGYVAIVKEMAIKYGVK